MGDVMVILKIFPAEPGIEDAIIEKLKTVSSGKLADVKKDPLAFGMFVIRAGFIIPDKEDGRMPALEKEVRAIEGINEMEVEGATLV